MYDRDLLHHYLMLPLPGLAGAASYYETTAGAFRCRCSAVAAAVVKLHCLLLHAPKFMRDGEREERGKSGGEE